MKNWNRRISRGQALTDQTGRPRTRDLTPEEIIARQRAKIEMLRQENDFLRQIRGGWNDVTSHQNPRRGLKIRVKALLIHLGVNI